MAAELYNWNEDNLTEIRQRNPRSNGWVGTANNYTHAMETVLKGMDCVYLVYGREVAPTTGTKHLQIYVYFRSQKMLSTLRRALPIWWQPARGEPSKNRIYCTKDGDFFERGTIPTDRSVARQRGGDSTKENWDEIVGACKRGAFDEVPAEIVMKHYPTMKALRKDYMVDPPALDASDMPAYWFYGAAGTGKSQFAREIFPDIFDKQASNKWFCGYQSQQTVLVDDFDVRHAKEVYELKRWGDRFAFPCETKNGSLKIRPKYVVVTSNYHPNQIWTQSADLEPIMRRYRVVRFYKENGEYKHIDEGRREHGEPLPCVPWFNLVESVRRPVIPDIQGPQVDDYQEPQQEDEISLFQEPEAEQLPESETLTQLLNFNVIDNYFA